MAAVRRILKHVEVLEATTRRRKCHRKPKLHSIPRGDLFLLVKDGQSSKNYCVECARPILEQAASDLCRIVEELEPGSAGRS